MYTCRKGQGPYPFFQLNFVRQNMKETADASVIYEESTRWDGLSGFPGKGRRFGVAPTEEGDMTSSHATGSAAEEAPGSREAISFDRIHFTHYTCKASQTKEFRIGNSHPYISMVFAIKNHNVYYSGNQLEFFGEIGHNQHNLLFIPPSQTYIKWIGEPDAELFVVNLTLDYFNRFYAEDHPLFGRLKECLEHNEPTCISSRSLPLTPRMSSLLYAIAHCEHTGYYRKMFMKSKVIELLMLQLEQYEQGYSLPVVDEPDQVNVEKMHHAREIILSNIAKPCSLIDLAQQVGTNECYLKKNFKKVYGDTVYGYLQQERMERSKEILLKGNKKIAEVAKMMGYKRASHFTQAFKKYFGYLPNSIRMFFLTLFGEPELICVADMLCCAA